MAGTVKARGSRLTDVPTLLRTYGVVLALVLLVIAVWLKDSTFLSSPNLKNLTSQWAPAGIMAVGVTYVIIAGGLDLSFAANFSLSAIVAAYLGSTGNYDPWLCFLAAAATGALIGAINGVLVSVVGINSFIATLGVSFALSSIAQILTSNVPYVVTRVDFLTLGTGSFLGIPYPSWLLLGFLVVGGIALSRTVYGTAVYAVGSNPETSRLSGIRVRTTIASTFVLAGLCAGVAGAVTSSQLGSAQGNLDPTILFDVITVVILGGTSLTGGTGAMWRTTVGLLIIASLSNAFNLLNIDPNYQALAKGGMLIAALALDSYGRRLSRRSTARKARARVRGHVATSEA